MIFLNIAYKRILYEKFVLRPSDIEKIVEIIQTGTTFFPILNSLWINLF